MIIKNKAAKEGSKIRPTNDNFPKSTFNYPVFCFKYMHGNFHVDGCEKDERLD